MKKAQKVIPVKRSPGCPCGCGAPDHDVSPLFATAPPTDGPLVEKVCEFEGTEGALVAFRAVAADLSDFSFWCVLGSLWVAADGPTDFAEWRALFSTRRKNRAPALMKPSELRALGDLPQRVTGYRVRRPGDWLSLTLDLDFARQLAAEVDGEVEAYSVPRRDVLALFTRRGEAEVVVLDRSRARLLGPA